MPCNCGSAERRREMLRTARNAPSKTGGYLLANYPGCTSLYHGPFEGESVYVVARNTPDERMFKRYDLDQATEYTLSLKAAQIENIPIVGLCQQAIDALYA